VQVTADRRSCAFGDGRRDSQARETAGTSATYDARQIPWRYSCLIAARSNGRHQPFFVICSHHHFPGDNYFQTAK
jgi:hypothetical protein